MTTESGSKRHNRLVRSTSIVLIVTLSLFLSGCVGVASGITPITDFELDRYLGKWYEIARLDHSFERGLEGITAEYSLRPDGGVKVLNAGYSVSGKEREIAEGKAYFVSSENIGHLKVSFFGPFYGSYVIFEIDSEGYEYAFVTSYKRSYLWLLARKPAVDQNVIDKFLDMARKHGFDTSELIFVEHS